MEEKQVKKRMSRRRIGILVLLLAGLAVLLYPVISTKWNDYRSRQLASSYQKSVQEKGDAALEEMKKEADNYNQTLFVPSVPDAFSIRDGVHDPAYEALLNPSGGGVMADLQIPAIHVDLPIYHYTSDESLSKGAGHLFGSSLQPAGRRQGDPRGDLRPPGSAGRPHVHGPQSAEEGRLFLHPCSGPDPGL